MSKQTKFSRVFRKAAAMCAEDGGGMWGALFECDPESFAYTDRRLCSLMGSLWLPFDSMNHRVITLLLAAEMEENP